LRRIVPGLLTALALVAPVRARAAGPADVAAADALFREARASAKKGDHAAACPKFRESYRLDPTVGTLLNVADCDEHDGHLAEALRRFEEAFGRLAPSDDRITYVRSRIHALDERVPKIVGTPADGLKIHLDGADVTSPRPLMLRVDPGPHEVRVLGPGRDEHLALLLKEGEEKDIDFRRSIAAPEAAPLGSPQSSPPPQSTEPHSTSTLGLVVGGIGVAGLAASGALVALMFDEKKTADAHCVGSECDQAGIDATASGKRFGTIGAATFAVSAVAVGVGTFLFFHGRRPTKEGTSVSLGPCVAPGGGGIVFGGTL
jgi:hypothetical protein